MICKICGKDTIENNKLKNGYICNDCFNALPRSFKENISKITTKQLLSAKKIIRKATATPWAVCESVKICADSIQIAEWEISLKDIKKIGMNFHPKQYGSKQGSAYGMITIVIETVAPKIMIEEPFIQTEIGYYINGKEIVYSYPSKIQLMLSNVQSVIDDKSYNTEKFKPKKEETHRSNGRSATHNHGRKLTEFERAKALYEVEIPFTLEEINKKKKELMKKYHPDLGGDTEKAIEINAAFDLLEKFAD